MDSNRNGKVDEQREADIEILLASDLLTSGHEFNCDDACEIIGRGRQGTGWILAELTDRLKVDRINRGKVVKYKGRPVMWISPTGSWRTTSNKIIFAEAIESGEPWLAGVQI